ncbi:MAG TPA: EpsI family protein [Bryobacteraceae bacterium]|nr:EpsI family protein [Bryobacteraceae bacterium]
MRNASKIIRGVSLGWLVCVGVVLVAQAAILRQLSVREVNIRVPELSGISREVGSWKAVNEQTLEPAVLDFLQPDGYILRDYANPSAGASMNLFVAFFKSLQNTAGPHSPHDCLPGSGWQILTSSVPAFPVQGWEYPAVQVNQYTMQKGNDRILVVYWYQNDRRTWAEEFKAKLTLLPDLIRYRRSDVSLVRLVTSYTEGNLQPALSSARDFTKLLFPSLVTTFQETNK